MKLSANFTLDELIRSDTALRRGIDNVPSKEVIASLTLLAEKVLQPIRNFYGKSVKVNSGYRSVALNTAVGGSSNSDHCKGFAADIEIADITNRELAKFISQKLMYTQLILEGYKEGVPNSGWVHVSYDPSNLKRQNMTATFINGKAVYTTGIA